MHFRVASSGACALLLILPLAGCTNSSSTNDGGSASTAAGSTSSPGAPSTPGATTTGAAPTPSATGRIATSAQSSPTTDTSRAPEDSSGKYVTGNSVGSQLEAALKRSAPDRAYGTANCGALRAQVDDTTSCTITVDGATLAYTATVKSVVGSTVNFEFTPDDDSAGGVPPEGYEDPTDVAPEDDATPGTAAETAKYGETYTSPSGRQIFVSAPQPYTPTEAAVGTDEGGFTKFTRVTVRLINKHAEAFDTNEIIVTATSGDRATEGIWDGDIQGVPARNLLPGRTLSFDLVFGYQPGQPLTIELSTFSGPVVTYDGVAR